MLIAAQIIGILAVVLYLLSYQFKKRVTIIWVTFISNAFYVLQYCLLGAFSGAVMDFLSTIAAFLAAKKHHEKFKKHLKWVAIVTELVIVATGTAIAFAEGKWIGFLPIGGAFFQTLALWLDDEQTIRKLSLCCTPFWLVYNASSKAYGATLGTILAIISIIVSLIRYKKGKTEKSS